MISYDIFPSLSDFLHSVWQSLGQSMLLQRTLLISFLWIFHSFISRHLGCFRVLANVNSAAMNIRVHVSFCIAVFPLITYIENKLMVTRGESREKGGVSWETRIDVYTLGMRIMYACLVSQSCPTLWDPLDYSPLGSSVCGIFQARILGWIAISSCRGSSPPKDWACVSCVPCIAGRRFTYWAAPLCIK